MENAVAVLDIFRSPAMKQACKIELDKALNRSLNQQEQVTGVADEVLTPFLPRDEHDDRARPRKYHGPRGTSYTVTCDGNIRLLI